MRYTTMIAAAAAAAALAIALIDSPALATIVPINTDSVELQEEPFDESGELLEEIVKDLVLAENGETWMTGTVTSRVYRQAGGNLLFQYMAHNLTFDPEHESQDFHLVSAGLGNFGTFLVDVKGGPGLDASRGTDALFIGSSAEQHDFNLLIRTDAEHYDRGGSFFVDTTITFPIFGSPDGGVTGVFQPVAATVIPLPAAAPVGAMMLGCLGAAQAWVRRGQ
jgi:hypothetical protein